MLILVIIIIYYATRGTKPTPKPSPTGPLKPFPVPDVPSSYPIKPIKTVELDKWEDYATTTQFGFDGSSWSGPDGLVIDTIRSFGGKFRPEDKLGSYSSKDKPFGNYLSNIKVNGEVTPVFGPMGGAIPWAMYAKKSKNRSDFITKLKTSALSGGDKFCYIVQPMNKYPKDLIDITDSTAKVNLDKLNNTTNVGTVIENDNKQEYIMPAFLVVPYEGCGGNCNKDVIDCFNSADHIQDFVKDFTYFKGKDCETLGKSRQACLIANGDNGSWDINSVYNKSSLQQKLYSNPPTLSDPLKNNDYFAVTDLTDWGSNISEIAKQQIDAHVNYCSGVNMHFDMAENTPLWGQNTSNTDKYSLYNIVNLVGTNATNKVVRYIEVPGNIFGKLDLTNSTSSCPPGAYNNGTQNCTQQDAQKTLPDGSKCCCPWNEVYNKDTNKCEKSSI